MWIDEIRIAGFGKLRGATLHLCRGMNLVVGPNEAGKTTLQDFIWAILYGADGDALSRYLPWSGSEFGGEIVYHLERGGEGRVELGRDFHEQTVRMKGGGARGNGVDPEEGDKEFPGRDHLGVDRNVFLSTCLIRQGEVSALRGRADISHRLMNLVESGDEEGSVERALGRIRRLVQEEIGSERGGKMKAALERLENLIREREDASFRQRDSWRDLLARRKEISRLERIERRIARAQISDKRSGLVALQRKIAEVRSLERQIAKIRETIDAGQKLPILDVEGLRAIQARREASREGRDRIEAEIQELEEKVIHMRSEVDDQRALLDLPDDAGEIVAVLRESLRSEEDEVSVGEQELLERRRQLQLSRNEHEDLARRYAPFEGNFDQVLKDVRATRRREGALSTRRKLLGEREQQARDLERRADSLRRQARSGIVLVGVLTTGLAFALITGRWIAAALIGVLAMGKIVHILTVGRTRRRRTTRETLRLARRIDHHREEIDLREGVMNMKKEVYQRAGVSSPEEFRKGFERYRELEASLPALEESLKHLSARFRRMKKDLSLTEEEGVELLRRAGCLAEGATPTLQVVDEFTRRLKDRAEQRREKELLEGLLSLKARELEGIEEQIRRLEAEARVILVDAGVDSVDAFEALGAGQDRVEEAERDLVEKQKRLRAYLGEASIEDLISQAESMQAKIPEGMDLDEEEGDDDETRDEERERLIEVASEGAVEGALAGLRQESLDAKRRIAALEGRIEGESRFGRHLADIESDIEDVGRRIVFFKEERATLAETARILGRLKEDFLIKRFNPRLQNISSLLVQELTGGRYTELRLDESLNLEVRAAGEERAMEISHLSLGTQDQIYFILRHVIGRVLSESGEPLPLILDETFVTFDAERRQSALQFLIELSKEGQVILLTCHRQLSKEIETACKKAGIRLKRKKVGEFQVSTTR